MNDNLLITVDEYFFKEIENNNYLKIRTLFEIHFILSSKYTKSLRNLQLDYLLINGLILSSNDQVSEFIRRLHKRYIKKLI